MGKKSNLTGLSRFLPQDFIDTKAASHSEQSQNQSRSVKKRKTDTFGPARTRYDATALVPHYNTAHEVPENLQKYFSQRKRYFSLYDQGCLLDEEGWYSVTPESIAIRIAERCRCDTILDPFCGVGGNAIAFAKTCEHVIALDISPIRIALARHNAAIYGVADRIEFILADYVSFANAYLSRPHPTRRIDVVFLSPPWGGPEYISPTDSHVSADHNTDLQDEPEAHSQFSLSRIQPIHGADLFRLTKRISDNIAYFLPRNTDLNDISALGQSEKDESATTDDEPRMIEVEEEWMGSKLKALTCYFGGLVTGQEHVF
ncbi:Tgs1 protein [Suillus paluster]|uniref:Tgs1 protein n=1 Tax=Suillus paluster TaxID=48578 RepID=UPI001B878502|nr:Tgs1 protein [Suillus paluster]XP_041180322.1 Tgs1 protein [Suillus paluster]KAG1719628.1 Tgs1 protein [Suillus paluster]KAG1747775.1 Tgs1 protein [Suillus paluster]